MFRLGHFSFIVSVDRESDLVAFWALTYMSIRDEISRLRRENALVWLPPKRPQDRVVRRVLLAKEVHDRIVMPSSADEERMAVVRAALDRFSTGGQIVVGNKLHKTCFMKQLEPPRDEIWEMRVRESNPGVRLLGAFSDTDFFVGLSLHNRPDLGEEGSKEWKNAIKSVKADWRRHFLTYKRHQGDSVNAYISRNAVDFRRLP